ncbi:MAG: helix-turn-helix transcriptional regulator [Firmicutes bacterium]|nr:helix-turn-helix transcriptional regulator [Bacillota bacterium]
MTKLGDKIAKKRKDLGLTQSEFAEKLNVTRQTVGRWEQGSILPDIEKISDIAGLLGVSCDYLLQDDLPVEGEETGGASPDNRAVAPAVSRLLADLVGRRVKLRFFEDEGDYELYDKVCLIEAFEGNWVRLSTATPKGEIQRLMPVSSILSFEICPEA